MQEYETAKTAPPRHEFFADMVKYQNAPKRPPTARETRLQGKNRPRRYRRKRSLPPESAKPPRAHNARPPASFAEVL